MLGEEEWTFFSLAVGADRAIFFSPNLCYTDKSLDAWLFWYLGGSLEKWWASKK